MSIIEYYKTVWNYYHFQSVFKMMLFYRTFPILYHLTDWSLAFNALFFIVLK